MLQAIRGKVGSWIVRILFVLLIVSFGVWGIGDVFRNSGPDQVVAEAGDVTVTTQAVDRAFRQEIDQMRQIFGPEFDTDQAIALGLLDRTVDTLVSRALLDQTAADLGLAPPEPLIAETIRSQPAFQNEQGQFDREQFLQVLAANGLDEAGYVAMLRQDLARERLVESAGVGAAAPATLAENLYRFRQEGRVAEAIGIPNSLIAQVPTPTEEQLQAFHTENGPLFTAPEYRALTLVTLDPETLAEEIDIPEETLRAEYDSRIEDYQTEETRRFDQIVLADEAVARQVAAATREGRPLAEAATAVEGVTAPVIPLDWTTRDTMLPALADAGFGLAEGAVSEPIQTPFGWHVLAATGVRPAGTRSFEEVRDELAGELKLDRALDDVFETANEFEDMLAGGASLDEAAQQLGLSPIKTPPLARDGRTQAGAAPPSLPARDAVLETAFALAEGEVSTLEDTPDGLYYAVRVDDLIEPAVRPFDEVRGAVAAAWTERQRADEAQRLADTTAERLRAGEDPATVAAEIGAEYGRTPALLRDGSNSGEVPAALVESLFDMEIGEVTVVAADDGRVVARLAEIVPADPASDADALAAIGDEAEQAIANDLVEQFTRALRQRYEVEIDRAALDRLYRPS